MSKNLQTKVFQYHTNSNAAPFFSDSSEGFIEATDPMAALKKVVQDYEHPAGLLAAEIREPTPKNPTLAVYLSAKAATSEAAPCGLSKWKQDGLYVNGKKVPERQETYKLVQKE